MSGFFKVHRSLWSSDSVSLKPQGEARRLEAWLWLLSLASWEDRGELKAGQCYVTRGQIARYTGWTDGKVRAWLKSLCKESCISMKRQGNRTILTVENWEKFQAKTRLDLGPSQCQASAKPVPSRYQASASSEQGLRADETKPVPSHDQARTELGPGSYKEERNKKEEDTPKPPTGANGVSLCHGGLIDERDNTWKTPPKNGAPTYSEPFEKIWAEWLDASGKNENITAADKSRSYRMCFLHLKNGTASAAQLWRATKAYLAHYGSPNCTTLAKQPPAFYRQKDPLFLEWLDVAQASSKPATPKVPLHILFQGPAAMGLQYAQIAAERLGADPVQTDATCKDWRVYNGLPENVRELAENLARFGFGFDHTKGAA